MAAGGYDNANEWRVLVAGHSWIDRLCAYLSSQSGQSYYVQTPDARQMHVKFWGVPGATFRSFAYPEYAWKGAECRGFWKLVFRWNPHIIIMILGGNDILEKSNLQYIKMDVEVLKDMIIKAVTSHTQFSFAEIEYRHLTSRGFASEKEWRDSKHYCSQEKYLATRKTWNNWWNGHKWNGYHNMKIPDKFYKKPEFYRSDGVHLGDKGMDKLWYEMVRFMDYMAMQVWYSAMDNVQ